MERVPARDVLVTMGDLSRDSAFTRRFNYSV